MAGLIRLLSIIYIKVRLNVARNYELLMTLSLSLMTFCQSNYDRRMIL
jgi:hypothetical protein